MKFLLLIILLSLNIYSQEIITGKTVTAKDSMIVTRHFLASEVGNNVLLNGGNAVDASVAISFALAVVLPQAGNIGGGGFMVYYDASLNSFHALDYREQAPAAAYEDMFIRDGKVDRKLAIQSYLSSGVPGSVHGLYEAHKRFGSLPWKELINPAIDLANKGFTVTKTLADSLQSNAAKLSATSDGRKIFFKNNKPLTEGELLVQKDLANTLRLISSFGADGFYKGLTAKKIETDMKNNDGLITMSDLSKYSSKFREPIKFNYKDLQIITMPPPSSGGLLIQLIFQLLELNQLDTNNPDNPRNLLLISEILQIAYSIRSEFLGDPDFYDVPFKSFNDREIIANLNNLINQENTSTPDSYLPSEYIFKENTTHFSVADKNGNVVSSTYTLNSTFGSGVTIDGTGVLMNNEMDDFSAAPGIPNQFGLLGATANEIQPKKRPLSSMTPTIVMKNDQLFFTTGSPGGSRIISAVLQSILNIIDFEMDLEEANEAKRIHHQWQPDILQIEFSLNEDIQNELEKLNYNVQVISPATCLQLIMLKNQTFYGYGDFRRPDAFASGDIYD